jgi:hypothetical protein
MDRVLYKKQSVAYDTYFLKVASDATNDNAQNGKVGMICQDETENNVFFKKPLDISATVAARSLREIE